MNLQTKFKYDKLESMKFGLSIFDLFRKVVFNLFTFHAYLSNGQTDRQTNKQTNKLTNKHTTTVI